MCGIAGVWGRAPAGDRAEAWRRDVEAMLATLRPRGPDGGAVAATDRAVLGVRRLAVIDPAGGSQPMATPDRRHVLAFNGAVVDFVEHAASLREEGVALRTRSDTEVLLHLLARDAERALARIDGMFAFAFADAADGSVLLARDPCGIKPLYWLDEGDRVLFASEVKALLAAARARPGLHEEALLDFLAFHVPLNDATFFEGVRRVPPGHALRLRPGAGPALSRLPAFAPAPDVPRDGAAVADALRGLLAESVRRNLRADVPLGAHLSGGTDSSLVAALAVRGGAAPLHVFTGAFDVAGFDERPHARAVAAEIGATVHETAIGPADLLDALPAALDAMDEPAAGPGLLPQWLVARDAARHVKVVLGGQGGDELFSGYVRHLVLRLEAALGAALRGGDTRALRSLAPHLASLDGYAPLLRRHFAAGLFEPVEHRYFSLLHRGAGLDAAVAGGLRESVRRHPARERFLAAFGPPDGRSDAARVLRFDRTVVLPALLQVEDRTSAAWSLESRVPLLGRRVLAFVDACPDETLFGEGALKHLLRRAAEPDLPRAARERCDKMGFPVPLAPWARGPLRAPLRELLLGGALRARGWIEEPAADALLDGESVEARSLWALLCVETWMRRHAA